MKAVVSKKVKKNKGGMVVVAVKPKMKGEECKMKKGGKVKKGAKY